MDDVLRSVLHFMKNTMNGYGSYVLGWATVAYGVLGFFIGDQTADEAMDKIWAGLALTLIRRGVANEAQHTQHKE